MKRIKLLFIVLVAMFILIACENKETASEDIPKPTEVAKEDEVKIEEPIQKPLTLEEQIINLEQEIPSKQELVTNIEAIFEELGINDFIDITIDKDNEDEKVRSVLFNIKTETRKLQLSTNYLGMGIDKWSLVSIINSDEVGIYYWVPKEVQSKVDLYNYKTNDLISASSEEFGDPVEEFNEKVDSINKEFDDKLEGLKDKYTNKRNLLIDHLLK